ncbi:MAG: hypothetical protein Q7U60_11995 [Candidatus Methanoperedens sp.]|nr:hypothetical protein [Candidatus Methanoperedens sp.]
MKKSNRNKQKSSKGKGWHGDTLGHKDAALMAEAHKANNTPMQKALIEAEQAQRSASKNFISIIKTTIKFVEPLTPIISKMIGLEEPALVTKAALNSFENLIDVYDKTKNIDDALISGVKSFVINYTKGEVENYVENVALITNKSDREYEVAIKGSVLMTSLYAILENIEDNL